MSSLQPKSRVRRQIRDFVLIWTGITFVMGACTFLAIFWVLGQGAPLIPGSQRNFSLPTPSGQAAALDSTPIPTRQAVIQPTPLPASPTAQSQAVQAPTQAIQQAGPTQPPPTPSPAPPTPTLLPINDKRYSVGIQVQYSLDFNPKNQDLWSREVAEKLGMEWFKQQVRWEEFEKERGNIDWGVLDLVTTSAAKYNLKMMISVVTAPDWAREPGVNLKKHGPPANNADYVNFVTAILKRYPNRVHAVEVWNEQNLDREWTSTRGLKAENYVALLRDTYTAVKQIDPGVIVISGALSPTGFSDGVGAWDDYVYLDQLIKAGLLNYTDCVGAHHNGYNIGPSVAWDSVPNDPSATFRGPFDNKHRSWSFRSTLQAYASRIALANGQQKLCVTEFGWPSTEDLGGSPDGFSFANDNTLKEQSAWTIEAINNMEQWNIVWLAFIWNLNYGPQAGWDPKNDNVPYSIIGKDWKFRPVYDAIIEWNAQRKSKQG
jgi:hypothetical protein